MMRSDNLIESIFEKVVEEKRNNTPIPTNEKIDLLKSTTDENDIELSAVEDNKDVVESQIDPIVNTREEPAKDTVVKEMIREEPAKDSVTEAIIREEPAKDSVVQEIIREEQEKDTIAQEVKEEKKSKYIILCTSLSKLICCK